VLLLCVVIVDIEVVCRCVLLCVAVCFCRRCRCSVLCVVVVWLLQFCVVVCRCCRRRCCVLLLCGCCSCVLSLLLLPLLLHGVVV